MQCVIWVIIGNNLQHPLRHKGLVQMHHQKAKFAP